MILAFATTYMAVCSMKAFILKHKVKLRDIQLKIKEKEELVREDEKILHNMNKEIADIHQITRCYPSQEIRKAERTVFHHFMFISRRIYTYNSKIAKKLLETANQTTGINTIYYNVTYSNANILGSFFKAIEHQFLRPTNEANKLRQMENIQLFGKETVVNSLNINTSKIVINKEKLISMWESCKNNSMDEPLFINYISSIPLSPSLAQKAKDLQKKQEIPFMEPTPSQIKELINLIEQYNVAKEAVLQSRLEIRRKMWRNMFYNYMEILIENIKNTILQKFEAVTKQIEEVED
ncbi:hypothetical protein NUSPORA_00630 [Nucleospora cyclopteri]